MILPDLLVPELALVFCGTAPSRVSAQQGAYYAHGGNLFWETLHLAGFTPERLAPHQYPELLGFGIGLTDLNKSQSGVDRELDSGAFDIDGLRTKISYFQPHVLAFTSKHGAGSFFGRRDIQYGHQSESIGLTGLWVLPSTSGSARPHWRRLNHYWYELGAHFRAELYPKRKGI